MARAAALGAVGVVLAAALAAGCGCSARLASRHASGEPARRATAPVAGLDVAAVERLAAPSTDQPKPVAGDRARRGGCAVPPDVGRQQAAYAAVALGRLKAYRRPGGRPIHTFGEVNQNGVKTVFAVRGVRRGADCEATWYRVQLPLRPNGTTGFVRARAVRLVKVRTRIVVDLSARKIELYRDGRRILRMPAAVGSPVTPTPTGDFYVNQKLLAANPAGPFGPGALGISAFSPVLRHWAQGGPIAIHGTNDPASIGRAVSHGCVRVSNDNLVRLWNHTPAGTPVEIRA